MNLVTVNCSFEHHNTTSAKGTKKDAGVEESKKKKNKNKNKLATKKKRKEKGTDRLEMNRKETEKKKNCK